MTQDNNRFSVFLLEKDVLEYHNAKNKYNEYDEQYHSCPIECKDEYKQKKGYWYKKYISKNRLQVLSILIGQMQKDLLLQDMGLGK